MLSSADSAAAGNSSFPDGGNGTISCFYDLDKLRANEENAEERWGLASLFNGTDIPSNISYFCQEEEYCCRSTSCCRLETNLSEFWLLWFLFGIIFFLVLIWILRRKSQSFRTWLYYIQSYYEQRGRQQSLQMAQLRSDPFTVL